MEENKLVRARVRLVRRGCAHKAAGVVRGSCAQALCAGLVRRPCGLSSSAAVVCRCCVQALHAGGVHVELHVCACVCVCVCLHVAFGKAQANFRAQLMGGCARVLCARCARHCARCARAAGRLLPFWWAFCVPRAVVNRDGQIEARKCTLRTNRNKDMCTENK